MQTSFDARELLEKAEKWVFANRQIVIVGFLGVFLIFSGFFIFESGVFEGTKVEILDSSQIAGASASGQEIVVEIAGSVEKPGVYELEAGARVDELLVLAGGLSAAADREWVSKNLNRAAKVLDGQKIYIPQKGESNISNTEVGGLVNLNTASKGQLESLSGIGAVRAQGIISGRPYSNIEELLSRKIISKSVYEKIKGSVTAP